ncbi:MAG: hypothetical protein NBV65_13850 [Burkholderiaceae bacterium]|nr:hypothetical protein [Burkholderiaceae bacterium]
MKPITGKIQNDGAAFVRLSPHKSVRNAVIIYEAIKKLPDQTLVRGDFDKKSRPLIYFPERPPKQVGKVAVDAIASRNARYDREEFASFMRSIIEATFKAASVKSPELRAAFNLKLRTADVEEARRDFTVGDIREPLRSIAKAYNRWELIKITSPHHTQQTGDSPLQAKRFKQFVEMKSAMVIRLCDALSLGVDSQNAEVTALIAIQGMKQMLVKYRELRRTDGWSFTDFLERRPIPREAQTFARLWLAMYGPDRSRRKMFITESWSLEMDKICPAILNEYRAAKRLKHRGGSSEEWGMSEKASAGSESESLVSSSQSSSDHAPRRRRISGTSSGEASTEIKRIPMPDLTRRSSMPELRRTSQDAGDKSQSSDPEIIFLDSQPEISTVIYSSVLPVSPSLAALSFVSSGKPDPVKARVEVQPSVAEDRSTEPDESNNADVFSQEEQ